MTKRPIAIGFGLLMAAVFAVAQTNAALSANLNKPCPKLGYCPAGSCAQNGTTRACNPKNCSPHNCRR